MDHWFQGSNTSEQSTVFFSLVLPLIVTVMAPAVPYLMSELIMSVAQQVSLICDVLLARTKLSSTNLIILERLSIISSFIFLNT